MDSMVSLRMQRSGATSVGAVALGSLLLAGCFSYQPLQPNLPVPADAQVGVVVNDRGRAILADRVGPLIDRVEGHIDRHDGGVLTLSVYRVVNVRGEVSTWTGEKVDIPEEGILGYRPRKLSKMRTVLFAGAVVAAIVLSLRATLNIFGDVIDDGGTTTPGQT